MADTNGKIKYLGMEGVEALLEGLKGEYSPLGHEHDIVINAENATNAEHSSTADEATHAEHASEADHSTTADEATKAIQDGNGNVIVDTYALKNHEHSWDELNDKPFYNEYDESDCIILDHAMPFEDSVSIGDYDIPGYDLSNILDLNENNIYVVTIDGVDYVGNPTYSNDLGCYYFGNLKFFGDVDTGEPFIIIAMQDMSGNLYNPGIAIEDQYNGKHIVIKGKLLTKIFTKQIDEEFIPDTIARVKDISSGVTSWNDLEDRPFYYYLLKKNQN